MFFLRNEDAGNVNDGDVDDVATPVYGLEISATHRELPVLRTIDEDGNENLEILIIQDVQANTDDETSTGLEHTSGSPDHVPNDDEDYQEWNEFLRSASVNSLQETHVFHL